MSPHPRNYFLYTPKKENLGCGERREQSGKTGDKKKNKKISQTKVGFPPAKRHFSEEPEGRERERQTRQETFALDFLKGASNILQGEFGKNKAIHKAYDKTRKKKKKNGQCLGERTQGTGWSIGTHNAIKQSKWGNRLVKNY